MSVRPKPNQNKSRYICFCNRITQEKIEAAIDRGCNTLPKIFDATTAGVGACGGSCRPKILKLLELKANGDSEEEK